MICVGAWRVLCVYCVCIVDCLVGVVLFSVWLCGCGVVFVVVVCVVLLLVLYVCFVMVWCWCVYCVCCRVLCWCLRWFPVLCLCCGVLCIGVVCDWCIEVFV